MPVQESPTAYLTSYVRLFVELHRLVANGAGDSDEADTLRDQLDRPWYKLSDVEKRMTDILAVNLYDFDDGRYEKVPDERLIIDLHLFNAAGLEETVEAKGIRNELDRRLSQLYEMQRERLAGLLSDLPSMGVSREAAPADSKRAAHEFEAAINRREWDLALSILREHESEIAPAEIAAMRGVCWARLGNHEIASLFFGEAVLQDRSNLEFEVCYLRSLILCGRFDDAQRKASFIANRETDPYQLLLAADVLFDCIAGNATPARDELERIVKLVELAAVGYSTPPRGSTMRKVACSGYLAAALCCEQLDDKPRADEMYRMARQLDDSGLSEGSQLFGAEPGLPNAEAARRKRTAIKNEFSNFESILRAA